MSNMVADGIIGTGMKRCIHRHPKHPDQRPLRPTKLLLTKSAISLAAEVGHKPPKLDKAANNLIETAMKICIYTHLIRGS
jgi:hypothetical protein